jgi:hypothetical protein
MHFQATKPFGSYKTIARQVGCPVSDSKDVRSLRV